MGENLNEVSNDYEEYEFIITEKGETWLHAQSKEGKQNKPDSI